ncbi:MAG: phytanoyl-CoA dioxygenase family protein [Pyrinomonadaceae bacterium]|nr:phytanoyl-CoA dioxygenase family protein [Pyrinomonadaceae bacterium]
MKLRIGKRDMEVSGKYLQNDLRSSNDLIDDPEALRQRMADDGYLLIRGLHERESVLAARQELLEKMAERGLLHPDTPLMDGQINPQADVTATTSVAATQYLADLPGFRRVVESPRVMGFFERYLGGPVVTYQHKWLRAAPTGASSPIHGDAVYMGRGTKQLHTCWTPLGDVPLQMGPIVLFLGSHQLEQVRRNYGGMDVDRDLFEGVFSDDPVDVVDKFGGVWATTDFQAGDALIFGIYVLHASLTNQTNRYRISVDTRYQLASEPVDERWAGSSPLGHYAFKQPGVVLEPLAISRARWGL